MDTPGLDEQGPRRERHDERSLDGRLTNLLFAGFVATLGFGLFLSMWFQAMCGVSCRMSHTNVAYLVTYVGFIGACVVAFGGARRAAGRGRARSIWPLLGIGIVVVFLMIGCTIASNA